MRMIKNVVLVASALLMPAIASAQAERRAQPDRDSDAPTDARTAGFELASLREEGGLTADAAAARAVETAPSIERAEATVQLAEAGASQAVVALYPRLELTARYTRLSRVTQGSIGGGGITPEQETALRSLIAAVNDPAAQQLFAGNLESQLALANFTFPQVLDQFALSASVTWPVSALFFQVLPAMEAADDAADASRYATEVERATIALRARETFYAYARARGALEVAQSAVAQLEAHRQQVDSLVQAGAAAAVDRMRVDAQLASARVGVAQAQSGVDVATIALQTLMHLPQGQEISLGEDLVAPVQAVEGSREELLAQAMRNRSELRALRAQRSARDHELDSRTGGQLPVLAVAGQVDYANPNQRVFPQTAEFRATWSVSALLTWSPSDFFAADAQASQSRAQIAQVDADLAALEDGLRIEVAQAHSSFQNATAALEAATVGIEAAEESYRVRLEQLRAGTAVTSDLIDTESELTRARLQLLNAAIDARLAKARLGRAVGR